MCFGARFSCIFLRAVSPTSHTLAHLEEATTTEWPLLMLLRRCVSELLLGAALDHRF